MASIVLLQRQMDDGIVHLVVPEHDELDYAYIREAHLTHRGFLNIVVCTWTSHLSLVRHGKLRS